MEVARARIEAALEQARTDSRAPAYSGAPRAAVTGERRLAIGDPQAPFERLLEILAGHDALGKDGRLATGVHLVSIGDHFDWGEPHEREDAARSGLQTLSWLAAHRPEQVTLILGNHDLSRVGEMARFDDQGFRAAQAEADTLYQVRPRDAAALARFRERYPELPTPEAAARDFSTFREAQRLWVASLLRRRRFSAAAASPGALLCHAGVTRTDLGALGLDATAQRDPVVVAGALNQAVDAAVEAWTEGTPLAIPALHRPGSAALGEGRGVFHQRPSHPDVEGRPDLFEGPLRRRFDPRDLPRGLTQAVGHIRDGKCRQLLRPWLSGGHRRVHGRLRHLRVSPAEIAYRTGLPAARGAEDATLLFIDGGMNQAPVADYEILDLDGLAVARRGSRATSTGTPA